MATAKRSVPFDLSSTFELLSFAQWSICFTLLLSH
jgi:hypothetical protein